MHNIIYIGDGLTDVPCFSLVTKTGHGLAFGVFDPAKKNAAKTAYKKLLAPRRVTTLNKPLYRDSDELGAILRQAVEERAAGIGLSEAKAV